jgi:hypothetical protein
MIAPRFPSAPPIHRCVAARREAPRGKPLTCSQWSRETLMRGARFRVRPGSSGLAAVRFPRDITA